MSASSDSCDSGQVPPGRTDFSAAGAARGVVESVRLAEVEAQRIVTEAEENVRRELAVAEEQAGQALEVARRRIQAEHESTLGRARAEADEHVRVSAADAEAGGRRLEQVPADRTERAVRRLVEEVVKRWQ